MTKAATCRVVVNDDGCHRHHLMRAARLIRKHPHRCSLSVTDGDGMLRKTVATWAPSTPGSRPWVVVTIETFAPAELEAGEQLSRLMGDLLAAGIVDETTTSEFEAIRSRLASIAYVATSLDDAPPRFANAFAATPWSAAHCLRLPNKARAPAERVELDPTLTTALPVMLLVARTSLEGDTVHVRLCEVNADRSRIANPLEAMRHLGEAA